ncbi:MAG: DUF2779 domain-containing protein [Candidatus Dojkabacteria bacterium]
MKISKSEYLMYLDAPMHLWAYVHKKLDSNIIDTFTKHLFEQGYEVQKYAKEYIEKILIPDSYHNTKQFNLEVTKSDGLFEARIDLLVFNEKKGNWDLIEIKSTNDIKPIHQKDLTFQYLIFSKHYKIGKCYILHLDKDYERKGQLSIKELFTLTDITEKVFELVEAVNIERFLALEVAQLEEFKEVEACIKPKKCPCKSLCHPVLPSYSLYDVARISKEKVNFIRDNYSNDIQDLPNDNQLGKYALTEIQRKQVDVAQRKTSYIDILGIESFLKELKYPLYFIDYESFIPAIPMYDNYKPYDQMPFQYSLHIRESSDSDFIHKEYLECSAVDPSVGLINFLKRDIPLDGGSIIIWSKFERTQNNAMSRRYPKESEFIENINSRLWDLMEIFQKSMLVLPEFKGSYSIKNILPVLVPELSYKGMPIADGSVAMTKWVQMVYGGGITAMDYSESEDGFCTEAIDIPKESVNKEEVKKNLLEYCKLDTWAMVKILEKVESIIKAS